MGGSSLLPCVGGLRGRQVLPVTVESKTYAADDLKKIVAGQRDAQVLGVNVHKDGKLQVFLYDQANDKIDWKTIECSECAQDKEVLVARVPQEVAGMLEKCFGWSCADPSARPAGTPPPLEACEPFPEAACSGADLFASAPGSATSGTGRFIDPKTAKLFKGGLWGLTVASAATALGLAIANPFVTREINGERYGDTLRDPAWVMGGVTVGLLAVTIPFTVLINRAQQQPTMSTGPATGSLIQCP